MRRLSLLSTVVGLLLGVTLAVPAASGAAPVRAAAGACNDTAYPPQPHATIMASTTTPRVGETIEASGTAYCPDEDVTITLEGVQVGTAHTDGQGSFDPPVKITKPGSALQLCGIGASGLAADRDCITLSTSGVDATTTGPGGSANGGGTSFTGVDAALLLAVAAVLLVGGGLAVRAGRRRRPVGAGS